MLHWTAPHSVYMGRKQLIVNILRGSALKLTTMMRVHTVLHLLLQLLTVLDMVNAGLAGPGVLTERAADFSRIKRVTTLLEASLLHLADSLALFT